MRHDRRLRYGRRCTVAEVRTIRRNSFEVNPDVDHRMLRYSVDYGNLTRDGNTFWRTAIAFE